MWSSSRPRAAESSVRPVRSPKSSTGRAQPMLTSGEYEGSSQLRVWRGWARRSSRQTSEQPHAFAVEDPYRSGECSAETCPCLGKRLCCTASREEPSNLFTSKYGPGDIVARLRIAEPGDRAGCRHMSTPLLDPGPGNSCDRVRRTQLPRPKFTSNYVAGHHKSFGQDFGHRRQRSVSQRSTLANTRQASELCHPTNVRPIIKPAHKQVIDRSPLHIHHWSTWIL